MPSMSPTPASVMVRLVCGQMRTWPPRASFNVAGATPAVSSEPDATLMPVPAGWATAGAPGTVANNSPSGAADPGDWLHDTSDSNGNSPIAVDSRSVAERSHHLPACQAARPGPPPPPLLPRFRGG